MIYINIKTKSCLQHIFKKKNYFNLTFFKLIILIFCFVLYRCFIIQMLFHADIFFVTFKLFLIIFTPFPPPPSSFAHLRIIL